MKHIITLVLAALALASVNPAKAGVKEIATVNGVKIVRVKTLGIWAPSTTTILSYDPNIPGQVRVLNHAAGTGAIPAALQPAGAVGAAVVTEPARTVVKQSGGGTGGGNTSVNVTTGPVNNSTTVNAPGSHPNN